MFDRLADPLACGLADGVPDGLSKLRVTEFASDVRARGPAELAPDFAAHRLHRVHV